MKDELKVYGFCTRLDSSRFPVYFFYEIEDGKVQVIAPRLSAEEVFVDINEPWKSLAGGRPNKPHRVPLEVTEAPKRERK
jgi:hypothetical protein